MFEKTLTACAAAFAVLIVCLSAAILGLTANSLASSTRYTDGGSIVPIANTTTADFPNATNSSGSCTDHDFDNVMVYRHPEIEDDTRSLLAIGILGVILGIASLLLHWRPQDKPAKFPERSTASVVQQFFAPVVDICLAIAATVTTVIVWVSHGKSLGDGPFSYNHDPLYLPPCHVDGVLDFTNLHIGWFGYRRPPFEGAWTFENWNCALKDVRAGDLRSDVRDSCSLARIDRYLILVVMVLALVRLVLLLVVWKSKAAVRKEERAAREKNELEMSESTQRTERWSSSGSTLHDANDWT